MTTAASMPAWKYKRTNRKHWTGKTIYEAYLWGEYQGDRLKKTLDEIRAERKALEPARVGIPTYYKAD